MSYLLPIAAFFLPLLVLAALWGGTPGFGACLAVVSLILHRFKSRPFFRASSPLSRAAAGVLTLGWLACIVAFELPNLTSRFVIHMTLAGLVMLASVPHWRDRYQGRALILFSAWLAIETSAIRFAGSHALFIAVTISIVLDWKRARAALSSWPAFAWGPMVTGLPFVTYLGILTIAVRPDLDRNVTLQRGAELLLSYENPGWPEGISHQVRFAAPLCDDDLWLIGSLPTPARGGPGMFIWDRGAARPRSVIPTEGVSENTVIDCKRRLAYVGLESSREVVAFRTDGLEETAWRVFLPHIVPRRLLLAEAGQALLVHAGSGNAAWRIDLDSIRVTPNIPLVSDPDTLESMPGGWIRERLPIPLSFAVDSDRNLMALSDPAEGTIRIHPLSDAPTDSRPIILRRGIRSLTLGPMGRILAAANYLTGEVTFIDTHSAKILRTYWVGHRIRSVHFTPDGSKAVAASHIGIFTLDVPPVADH